MKYVSFKIFTLILLTVAASSCKKDDVADRSSGLFAGIYEHNGSNATNELIPFNLSCAIESSTGHLYTTSTENISPDIFLVVMKTDAEGNKEWIKSYPVLRRLDTNIWNIIELEDGTLFINSRRTDEILRINSEGDIIYHKTFIDDWDNELQTEAISEPLVQEDGTLYLSARYSGSRFNPPTKVKTVSIDENGDAIVLQQWTDENFATILYHNVVYVDVANDSVWYISSAPVKQGINSTVLLNFHQQNLGEIPTGWSDMLSPPEDTANNLGIVPNHSLSGPQRHGTELLVLSSPDLAFGVPIPNGNPIRFCRSTIDWAADVYKERKLIHHPTYSYSARSFTRTEEGEYYICGVVDQGLPSEKAFLVKLNNDLEVVLEKYDYDETYRFNHISMCEDGNLLICGYTIGSGQGNDTKTKWNLLCRLDADGSL